LRWPGRTVFFAVLPVPSRRSADVMHMPDEGCAWQKERDVTMTQSGEHLGRAAARAALYSLLAQALNYPDGELVKGLCRGDYLRETFDTLDALGITGLSDCLETLRKEYPPDADEKSLLLELERDYTWMCFASKPHRLVYLFESVYNEGKLFDESTFSIARLYYEAGLKVEEDFRLPPDHIAVELEFMSFLCFKEVEGIKAGDSRITDYAVELQRRTLDEHLRRFALTVAANLGKHSKTRFYQSVAKVMTALFSGPA